MGQKISSADTTNFSGKSYANTAAAKDPTLYPSAFSITSAQSTSESEYQNTNFSEQLGAYLEVSELAGLIDRKAQFVVGKGFEVIKNKSKAKYIDQIKGNGLDSFNTILYNAVRTFTIGGDFFAEIIRNKRGEIRNIKPLNPSTVKVVANSKGIITKYKLYPQGAPLGNDDAAILMDPDDILHLAYNRVADQIHGQSVVKKLLPVIEMRKEAMNDLRVVFHRYVKPLWIFSVDTDDTTEVTNFKNKVDDTIEKAENLVVPKDTVDNIERISIPQFSTLDPLPWVKLLQEEFLKAEGCPEVIMGQSGKASEAESKILYLAWQQVVEFNQMFLEEQILSQLGFGIKLEFPASIAPELIKDDKKDSPMNKQEVTPGRDSK